MITVELNKTLKGFSLTASGHASSNHGRDIICAAVSALLQNALLGFSKLDSNIKHKIDDGYLKLETIDSECSLFLLETTIESLKQIGEKIKIIDNRS